MIDIGAHAQSWLFGLFIAITVCFLIVDLGYFNRQAHVVATREALLQSVFWVFMSCVFGGLIYFFYPGDHEEATLIFFSGYLMEKALSIDNIFVIVLIFRYLKTEEKYYHRILFWGIIGSILFRGIFILAGSFLIEEFHWILYLFGLLLIYSGIKVFFESMDEGIEPPKDNFIVRLAKRYLPMVDSQEGGKFFVRTPQLKFTSLFMALILVETTDLIFAIDSIPAVFAITQDEFLIYTSNIFAVLGLRAMFFLLMGVVERFYLLQKGLAIILLFIGLKMLLEMLDLVVPIKISFMVILAAFGLSILLSVLIPRKAKVR